MPYVIHFPVILVLLFSGIFSGPVNRSRAALTGAEPCAAIPRGELNMRLDAIQRSFEAAGYVTINASKTDYDDLTDYGLGTSFEHQGVTYIVLSDRFEEQTNPLATSCLQEIFLAHEWAHNFYKNKDTQATVLALEILAGRAGISERDRLAFWRAVWFFSITGQYAQELVDGRDPETFLDGLAMPDADAELYNEALGSFRGLRSLNPYFLSPMRAILEGLQSGVAAGIPIPNLQEALR